MKLIKFLRFLKIFVCSCLIFASCFLPIHPVFIVLIVVAIFYFLFVTNGTSLFKRKNNNIKVFFGQPGAGKTTLAAAYAIHRHHKGVKVLSNVNIKYTYMLDPIKDLGTHSTYFDGDGCSVIIDEATIDFDGRGFKSFSPENRNYFSLFRHDCNEILLFSQAVDVDKRIRDRATTCYYLQRSLLPFFISIRKIKKIIDVDENTKQLVDGFIFQKFSNRLLFVPPYWRYFDTLDRDLCCKKEKVWHSWGNILPDLVPASESECERKVKISLPSGAKQ